MYKPLVSQKLYVLFNNGYDVTVMNTSATQLTMQQPVVSSLDPVWPVSDTTIACQGNINIYRYTQYCVYANFNDGNWL